MAESRRIAVVMFTDIVGYTAMMQQDETDALSRMQRYKKILQATVKEHHGTIIQYFGDGGLVIFSSSSDAVRCSGILQNQLRQEPQVPVRIGIHMGEILMKEGNIFGDCVNVASRIESMGKAGSVLVSESVQKQLKNRPDIPLVPMGRFEFKNVAEPMEVFALQQEGAPVPKQNGFSSNHRGVNSIAVLPFVNMSSDPDQEYFGDGIAEEIINSLVHLKDLDVAGRTSSFQFKGKNLDLREVGSRLAVKNVLEGSVRKQGNKLRITAQLIKVDDGYHLWSERYDREIDDVFAIQDEIALAISEKLMVTLLKKERELLTKTYTQNTDAYELYLKGKFFLEKRGATLLTSVQCFREAIDLDPQFALAHAGFSDANLLLATYGLALPRDVMPLAKKHAEKALELDPKLCQPYYSLGFYYTCYEWNWPEGKKHFLKSIEINPKYPEARFRYGFNYLACVEGDFKEAEKQGQAALQLEPLSALCFAIYSMILHHAGNFTEALAACKKGIELDGHSFLCHLNAGRSYMALHEYDEASDAFRKAMLLTRRHHFTVNALIWIYCLKGDLVNANKLMDELKERSNTEYVGKTFTAISAAFLGNVDEAMDLMEEAYLDRDPNLSMLRYERFAPEALKNDPRYQSFLERFHFPG